MSDHNRAHQQLQFDFAATEIPYGYCHCGCGQLAPIHKKTRNPQGHIKGEPAKYIRGHNGRVYAPPGFKVCSLCQETKPVAEFYSLKGGKANWSCVPCAREHARAFWIDNRDELRRRGRQYQRENKEILRAKERERRADPDFRKKASIRLKDWRERNKGYVASYNRTQQVKARNRVNKVILSGKLPRPDTLICDHCHEVMASHYHHYAGYERENWLKIIPLCTACHGKAHRL
jgi:hypothetical protein